ncbi:MAG: dynamin family protein [Campylobacter sp.]|nr:dynamin family protein [Campylobacter sp.]
MNPIDLNKSLETIVDKYDLHSLASPLKGEFDISKSKELQTQITNMQNEGRTLKLGIIGRVKSGKSSLLNALVFDGKDVLPKAATPMTAALTILRYGSNLQAEVDFFSQEDIDDIEKNAMRFKQKLDNVMQSEIQRQCLKARTQFEKLSPQEQDELKQKATKRAKNALKDDLILSSAYDQNESIRKNNISLSELEKFKTITASSLDELNEKLADFVGANGKYTPYTKSVSLNLNQENLKDIEIIDTPGVNDPVVSREERTKKLLSTCDVVLIVSPSGQFLNSQDLDLLHRVTSKNDIREIYLVASKVDNELFGDDNKILPNVLSNIKNALSNQQKTTLQAFKTQNPEIQDSLDDLIKGDVILTSSVAYTMIKDFNKQESWDENPKHVWNNLTQNYPDYFTPNLALSNLQSLCNIEIIKQNIQDVKTKKDEIMAKRRENFIATILKNLNDYAQGLTTQTKQEIQTIQNSDLGELKEQIHAMKAIKNEAVPSVNEKYNDDIENLELNIKQNLLENAEAIMDDLGERASSAEGTATREESYEVSTSRWYNPFSWGDTETRYRNYTVTTVRAGFVRDAIEKAISKCETLIDNEYKINIKKWRDNLYKGLISVARQKAGDDILDIHIISRSIRNIINSVNYPDIDYQNTLPSSLCKSGTLEGSDADYFIREVYNFKSNLRSRVKNDVRNSVSSLAANLKAINIGEDIFQEYSNEIEKRLKDVENKEEAIDRHNLIIKEISDAIAG